MIKVDVKNNHKLRDLTKKYDELSDFGKEMIFCWMVGYGDMFDDDKRYDALMHELDNWKTRQR